MICGGGIFLPFPPKTQNPSATHSTRSGTPCNGKVRAGPVNANWFSGIPKPRAQLKTRGGQPFLDAFRRLVADTDLVTIRLA